MMINIIERVSVLIVESLRIYCDVRVYFEHRSKIQFLIMVNKILGGVLEFDLLLWVSKCEGDVPFVLNGHFKVKEP